MIIIIFNGIVCRLAAYLATFKITRLSAIHNIKLQSYVAGLPADVSLSEALALSLVLDQLCGESTPSQRRQR